MARYQRVNYIQMGMSAIFMIFSSLFAPGAVILKAGAQPVMKIA